MQIESAIFDQNNRRVDGITIDDDGRPINVYRDEWMEARIHEGFTLTGVYPLQLVVNPGSQAWHLVIMANEFKARWSDEKQC